MKLERGLQSTHNLKKSTYRMLRKLHCFESRGAMRDSQRIGRDYCILIFLKHKLSASIQGNVVSLYILRQSGTLTVRKADGVWR